MQHLEIILLAQVNEELKRPEPSIHALSSSLRELAEGVSREMAAGAPLPPSTRLDDLKPFCRSAVSCLSKLHAVLDVVPPAQSCPAQQADPVGETSHPICGCGRCPPCIMLSAVPLPHGLQYSEAC